MKEFMTEPTHKVMVLSKVGTNGLNLTVASIMLFLVCSIYLILTILLIFLLCRISHGRRVITSRLSVEFGESGNSSLSSSTDSWV